MEACNTSPVTLPDIWSKRCRQVLHWQEDFKQAVTTGKLATVDKDGRLSRAHEPVFFQGLRPTITNQNLTNVTIDCLVREGVYIQAAAQLFFGGNLRGSAPKGELYNAFLAVEFRLFDHNERTFMRRIDGSGVYAPYKLPGLILWFNTSVEPTQPNSVKVEVSSNGRINANAHLNKEGQPFRNLPDNMDYFSLLIDMVIHLQQRDPNFMTKGNLLKLR
jgi:hypothetical protein